MSVAGTLRTPRGIRWLAPAILLGTLLAGATQPAAACTRSPDAAPREPYTGFQPTGYKGGLERDRTWFAAVRVLSVAAPGTPRYRFKSFPSAAADDGYESIEPLFVGGRQPAFAAFRKGCAELFDVHGTPIDVAPFADWKGESRRDADRSRSLVTFYDDGRAFDGGTYRHALFRDGRLVARSPHGYVSSYTLKLQNHWMPPTQRVVAVASEAGMGVLDLETLREIVEPRFDGVAAVVAESSPERVMRWYWRVMSGAKSRLVDASGQDTGLPPFDDVVVVRDWANPRESQPTAAITAVEIVDRDALRCDVRTADLKPLVEAVLLRPDGRCPRPIADRSGRLLLAVAGADRRTSIYVVTPGPSLRPLAREVTGVPVASFEEGPFLLRSGAAPPYAYRVVDTDGTTLGTAAIRDYRPAGCGRIEVQVDGAWTGVFADGRTGAYSGYPFSC